MNKILSLIILVAPAAFAQVPAQVYQDHVVNQPRLAVNPIPLSYWDSKRVAYNQVQVVSVPQPVQLPTTQQVAPLPGQTEEQRRRLEEMSR
jgi:hypothetical protein